MWKGIAGVYMWPLGVITTAYPYGGSTDPYYWDVEGVEKVKDAKKAINKIKAYGQSL